MSEKRPKQNPSSDEMNIRSPEERFGGEGHAGTDPFAKPTTGRRQHPDADPSVEIPNATVEELVQQPESAKERAENRSKK